MKKLLVLLLTFPFLLFTFNCFAQLSVSTVIANVHCYGQNNGAVTANPTGGTTPYTYLWSPGRQTTQGITGLTASTYSVKVTDHAGLTASTSASVTQPSALIASVSSQYTAICAGQPDSLFVTGSGGTVPYQYYWTGPLDDISSPTAARTLCYPYGAAYIVSALDDLNGCTATASVSITVHTPPLTSISGPLSPIAPGRSDTLIALAAGATSYLWSNGNTNSSIIVSPSISTTYSVKATNTYSCYDTAHYTIDTNSVGNGSSSGNAIRIVPSTSVITSSYSSMDSEMFFSFVAADSNMQIIAYSSWLGLPVPHVHRLSLYNHSMQTVMDEDMPAIVGANQIRLDISHLNIDSTYYVRASRCPASTLADIDCNPSTHGECNASMRWDFQMCFRTVSVFVPDDSGAEAPAVSQLYYEHRGQITDLNGIPRFDIKAYTNNTKPEVFCTDSAVSFVYEHTDTEKSFVDTFQRVDMTLTGASVQPSQPVFKMQEDSDAGYLNYFLGHVPNGVPKVEGYSRLVYKNVYPNVDMQIFSNNSGTKLYFICNPAGSGVGAGNPANIELQFKGANSVSVNGSNGLDVVTEVGTLSFAPGFAYTDSAGIVKAKSWQAYFIAVNSNTVRLNTGAYNTNEPLVIEIDRGHLALNNQTPIANLDWSTYFGGTDEQSIFYDVCSDKNGEVYATGCTQTLNYPVTTGVVQDSLSNDNTSSLDATVAKFSNSVDSDKRVWATYFGGSNNEWAYGIKTDAMGNIYITGKTMSFDFPFASAPSSSHNYVQGTLASNIGNAFIAMFSNDGTKTYWTTYYGGLNGNEQGNHIAIDADTNIYIVGSGVDGIQASQFPLLKSTKPGSYNDSTYGTGFILEFNATHAFDANRGISRVWATRIGDTDHLPFGNSMRSAAALYGCTVDDSDNFYVTGTASYGYTNSIIPIYPCKAIFPNVNAVITKFNSNNNIVWSSYYGGNGHDVGYAITADRFGNVYMAGHTASDSIGTGIGIETKKLGTGYFQRYNKDSPGNGNGFIAEFSSGGSLEWGTYFGSIGLLYATAIYADAYTNLYVTGRELDSIPLPAANIPGTYGPSNYVKGHGNSVGDAFLAVFNSANTNPDYFWGTYFGSDQATGLCFTEVSNNYWLYIVGNVGGGYTPLVFPAGSYQQSAYFFQLDTIAGSSGTSFISQFSLTPLLGPNGVNLINSMIGEVKVYPNPTNQNITVQFSASQNEDVVYMLYNLMGEMVYDKKVSESSGMINQVIDMSSLPNGIYLLKVNEGDKYMTQKIVKQY